jgi:hypothetical protein
MKDTDLGLEFKFGSGKKLEAVFDEPEVTSDFGAVLMRSVEEREKIVSMMAGKVKDERDGPHTDHTNAEMMMQRVFQITCGYEDANDCNSLRKDVAFRAAVKPDPDDDLSSQPTISRLENRVTLRELLKMGYGFVDHFIGSYDKEPEMIVLDLDPTTNICHGHQQMSLFNAFEDEYCLMPFHMYEGLSGKFITAMIRPGKTPTDREIIRLLKRVVRRLQDRWRRTQIVFRADSHHTKPEVMGWMEENKLKYITGLSPNAVLERQFGQAKKDAELKRQRSGQMKARVYAAGYYKAQTWSRTRRVICRAEASADGVDMRFIVTNFEEAGAKYLYEVVYCGRGKMELMIKDHKTALKSDRTSCSSAEANQFRLFLHSAAYVLMHSLRSKALEGTALAKSQFDTIRLRLLKVGARVEVKKRKIRFHLPESFMFQEIYRKISELFGIRAASATG